MITNPDMLSKRDCTFVCFVIKIILQVLFNKGEACKNNNNKKKPLEFLEHKPSPHMKLTIVFHGCF